ncbi:MAG: aminotransferase class I/II-fold pyridoxal phosphate-dependent enzyme [Clostridiales Family XIII bacterium]|jgi:histidinol-phosphate aminotransferase|nr:aminotransferase class I/II-fold pyridoxal phosphate-dependent enzyme [Clostridiales Family XIII bacterium]
MTQKKWKENFIRVKPYEAGEQPKSGDAIKLNANENPYPPAPGVEALLRSVKAEGLRRYPQADGADLCRALAAEHGLDPTSVFVANGSDEVLALAFRAFFNSKKPVLFPDVTYSFYPVWCELFGIACRRVALDGEFRVRAEDYAGENGGVVLANPNAPTGIALPLSEIEGIVSANRESVVIVDEAYIDFGARSAVGLTARHENLLVTQSFSKGRALAGLRLGMAFGHADLIAVLGAVKNAFNSYPVDSLAAAAGVASIADGAYFAESAARVIATRERAAAALRGMGFSMTDSAANFLFVTHADADAAALFAYLKERGILVRHFAFPRTERHLRITVGTDAEMDRLLEAVSDFLRKGRSDAV